MNAPIPSLRGTATHALAVVVYQGHHGDGAGVCLRCGHRAPCPARRHAASVIAAAGEDPRWYDGRLSPGPAPSDPTRPGQRQRPGQPDDGGQTSPGYTGYSVGGRGIAADSAGYRYERDPA